MDDTVKVSLLAVLMLLVSANAYNYESLTEDLREYVDKSLEKTRNDYPNHYVSFSSINPEIPSNVRLQVSKCKKKNPWTDICLLSKNILYVIDCLVCETTEDKELVDCGKWKEVKNNERVERRKCRVTQRKHLTGGNTLFSKSEDSLLGCLGCM